MGLIFFTGMPGVGKTTIGALVAERLDLGFIDLDQVIEQRAERSIKQIFLERGEREFRDLEASLLDEVCEEDDAVIALGAGAVERSENFDKVMQCGTLVYLRADLDLLVERNWIGLDRPLLSGVTTRTELRAQLNSLLNRRKKRYAAAPVVVDVVDNEAQSTITSRVIEELRWRGGWW